jgi:ABC-type polysaccharide/polyol phosphate transport system ATPase subunit
LPGPVVIEARGIEKSFRIPEHRIDSIKERVARPLTRMEYRDLHALRGISFDVHQGEFFGIVGRNGSGKSCLLKILASIYRADAGRVRMGGRVAPFIELGVGFNPELTARENGVLNGVLMGLTLRQARSRLDAVLEFAELEDFVDLKLKNYSSGMLVRFAFAVMVEAKADIMLIDEVLAVGDAAFAQKCMDVFHERRRAGTTIVLVTHDMGTVQSLCHRALVIDDGEQRFLGGPEDAALQYLRLNFAGAPDARPPEAALADVNARVVHARLRDTTDESLAPRIGEGTPIALDVVVEAVRELDRPAFALQIRNSDGVLVFDVTRSLDARVAAGARVRLAGQIENRLSPGRHFMDAWIGYQPSGGPPVMQGLRLLDFVVDGAATGHGVVALETDLEPVLEEHGR